MTYIPPAFTNHLTPLITEDQSEVFEKLSIKDCFKLKNFTKLLDGLRENSINLGLINDLENDIQKISDNLTAINLKVANYSFSFFDIFNGKYIKFLIFRKSLPNLIKTIQEEAIVAFGFDTYCHDGTAENDVTKKIPIKIACLNRVHRQFLKENPDQNSWTATASAVDAYIQDKLNDLHQGNDVALPRFFHATHYHNLDTILSEKNIKQTTPPGSASEGFGAYASTYDERSDRYGFHTFALTAESLYCHDGMYFRGSMDSAYKASSVWLKIESDFTLNSATVAHLVIPTNENRVAINSLLCQHNLEVPVINEDANKYLMYLFAQVIVRQSLPNTWSSKANYQLPNHVRVA